MTRVLANETPTGKLERDVAQDHVDQNTKAGPVATETTSDGIVFRPDRVLHPP
jgi:hypothetical protein